MGLIPSTSYLAVFSAGTLIGAASTYFVLKLRHHKPKVKGDPVWSNGMEERYEVCLSYFLNKITQECCD